MIKQSEDVYWHGKLPIGKEEEILAIFKHHWFIYAQIWALALFAILSIVLLVSLLMSSMPGQGGTASSYRLLAIAGTGIFVLLALLFALIPSWLKSQERLILTEESLLQVLQPGIFANKVSQLGLQHVNDVSVKQGFFGHMFNFGALTIETPGEQQNYNFPMVGEAQLAARQIIEAHESYDSALQSGRVPTSFGGASEHSTKGTMQVNQKQYEEFLAFKKAMESQGQATSADASSAAPPTAPAAPMPAYDDRQNLPPAGGS